MSEVHDTAARGFDIAADVYERARPGYPAPVVDAILEGLSLHRGRILDLGAGTGKFTRELVARQLDVVAVEPVAGMRARLSEALPAVEVLEGTAEAIPLPDESVEGVVVAQAFHWFDAEPAAREIARVLVPDSRLALVWNVRDERTDWVREITSMIDPYEGSGGKKVPRYRDRGWRPGLEAASVFDPVSVHEIEHEQPMNPDGLVARVASTSFIAVLDDAERTKVLDAVRALTRTHPALAGRSTFEFPYVAEIHVFARR